MFRRHVPVPVQPAEHGELLRTTAAWGSCTDEPAPLPHLPVRVAARPPLLPPAAAPSSAAAAAACAATPPSQVRQHQRQDLLLGCQVQRYRGIEAHRNICTFSVQSTAVQFRYSRRRTRLHSDHTCKKENQIFLIYKEIRMEQFQSHIWVWLTASSYMGKYLRISSYIRKPFLTYDFATAPLWISLYVRKIWFFLSVH